MGYYAQGDYYAAGGPFDFIKNIVGTGLKIAGGVGSAVGSLGVPFIGAGGRIASGMGGAITGRTPNILPMAPSGGMMGRTVQTQNGGEVKVRATKQGTLTTRKRARMNYGNVKALRRADRRIDGFVGVAKKALVHTNYKVVSRSAGTRARARSSCGSCHTSPCKCG